MNATAEPGLEGEEGEGFGVEGDEEDDILYQKDASFSAHLDLSNLLVSPSDLLEETTPPPQENVHFVPVGGATFAPPQPPCLLDCGVGVCSNIPATTDNLASPTAQRCQCPLGRIGTHCETGE